MCKRMKVWISHDRCSEEDQEDERNEGGEENHARKGRFIRKNEKENSCYDGEWVS